MTKEELREEIRTTLRGMYWVPQDKDKWSDAVHVETDNLMDVIEQYAQQGRNGGK